VLWPSNLFLKFAVETGYLHGLLVDYLLPKLFVTDLLIVALLATWCVELARAHVKKRGTLRGMLVGGVLILLLGLLQLDAVKPLAAFWFLAKIVEMVLLVGFLVTHRQYFKERVFLVALMLMLTIQSVVGLGQFFTQSSVFPSYAWLGETRLEKRAGLARGTFENVENILPYGTTPHPNVLGAVLAIGSLALWSGVAAAQTKRPTDLALKIAAVAVSLLALATLTFTQSWSAWLTLAAGCAAMWLSSLVHKHRHDTLWGRAIMAGILTAFVVVPFVMLQVAKTYPDNTSFTRRSSLNQTAWQLWREHPWKGVGLNQFTAKIETVSPSAEIVRFVQPVHHVGLLVFSEVGVIGVILAAVWIHALYRPLKSSQRRLVWATGPYLALLLLPIAALDHFLVTQHVGQLTLVIGSVWIATNLLEKHSSS